MQECNNIKQCRKLVKRLEKKPYFNAARGAYDDKYRQIESELIHEGKAATEAVKEVNIRILSHLHDVMRAAKPMVEEVINLRIEARKIKNADQARKSVAGNVFQQMFAYALAQNVICGNITGNVIVTTSVSKMIDQYAEIHVGEDVLKPDSDVIVYEDCSNADSPVLNFSCKTSCKERVGQTYKWKLLCDLATCNCEHKENNQDCPCTQYNLSYVPKRNIKVCFVTTDFYDELKNPQIRSMLHFFDYSYIAKTHKVTENIQPLQNVITDINNIF